MSTRAFRWLKRPSLWLGAMFITALALAAACSDTTMPRFIPPQDSTKDTTDQQGFLVQPDMGGEFWV